MAIEHVERLYVDLVDSARDKGGLLKKLLTRLHSTHPSVKGLYLWGRVGRGKTYIIDAFYDCLPIESKQRIHFHSFMRNVHAELKQLGGETEPLKIIATPGYWVRAEDLNLN